MRVGKTRRKKKTARKISTARKNVMHANSLVDPLKQLTSSFHYERNGLTFYFDFCRVEDINCNTLDWILDLEERNMKTLYENCEWGWDLKKKKIEMTGRKARYLIAKSSNGSSVGFCHFQFDMDYGFAVLYCYEIQLEESVRGLGLGKYLMTLLERIAFSNEMQKVVLTVFKHNYSAYKFFSSLGYSIDITSPQDNDDTKYCYVILSKPQTDYLEQTL